MLLSWEKPPNRASPTWAEMPRVCSGAMCLAHESTWQFGLDEPSSASSSPLSFLNEAIAICFLPLLLFMDVCTCMRVYLPVSVCCAYLGMCVCLWTYVWLCMYLHSPPTLVIMNNPTLLLAWCSSEQGWQLFPARGEAATVLDSTGHPGPAVTFMVTRKQPQEGADLLGKLLWHRDLPLVV